MQTPSNDTPALLPPDPTREAHYWLRGPNGHEVSAKYRWACWRVEGDNAYYGALFMTERGYTLATPHPIPGPAALEAVYAALSAMGDEASKIAKTACQDADYGWLNGTLDAIRMLRAALETKETR